MAIEVREVPLVIFDGDCGFCTSSAHWVARRLNRRPGPNVALVPWQFTDLAALGTTAERAQREALWVGTDGEIRGGAAAFAKWLTFRGGAYAVAGRLMNLPLVSLVSRRRLRRDREEPASDAGRISSLCAPPVWL